MTERDDERDIEAAFMDLENSAAFREAKTSILNNLENIDWREEVAHRLAMRIVSGHYALVAVAATMAPEQLATLPWTVAIRILDAAAEHNLYLSDGQQAALAKTLGPLRAAPS